MGIGLKSPGPVFIFLFATLFFGAASGTAQVQLPANTYVPPRCQNQPITLVSRAAYLALSPTAPKNNPPILKVDQLKVFEALTSIINRVYLYTDFNGVNWPKIVTETRAKVESGLATEAFYTTMEEFVSKLGDEHSRFDSPAVVAAETISRTGQEKFVGIGVLAKALPGRTGVAILAVLPDSPASHGGLKEHDSIIAVDGLPMVEKGITYQLRLRGPECSATVLTVQSPAQERRALTVVRYQVAAPAPVYARLVQNTEGARIGYIFLPSFLDLTIPGRIRQALKDFGQLDGLIIDNRMNTGGSSEVLFPVLNIFASGAAGNFVSRAGSRLLEVKPDPVGDSQKIPLVILVSKDTVSYGEVFAGILQDLHRATVVGTATAGRVETLRGYNFLDGSRAWIAQEGFQTINSRAGWRKSGVKPDVEIAGDWDTFTFETDPGVAAALMLFSTKKQMSSQVQP